MRRAALRPHPQNPDMPRHPDRLVPLAGASNFRDLGGYRGQDGRRVRWRRLFRSDHLGELTPPDHDHLAALGVSAAFDFRGQAEAAAAPYRVPGLARHALAIEPTVAQRMQDLAGAGHALTVAAMEGLMRDLYRGLIRHQAPQFSQFFRHLLAAEGAVVFHCTAGKDRTGVAAALLLLALGVPRDTVMADYLLTNEVFKPPRPARSDIPAPVLQALWSVQPSYLEAAFTVLDQERGGAQAYLRTDLGLGENDLERLAQRYLQAP